MSEVKLTEREKQIAHEAFTTGRVYANMGEKESPVEICDKLFDNCKKAVQRFEASNE